MSKQFEELSKNLAGGMSRRKAFGRFFAGTGAAIGALVLRRPARAEYLDAGVGEFCVQYCRDCLGLSGAAFGACVSECVNSITTNVNRI